MSKKDTKADNPKGNTLDLFFGLTNDELDALAALPATKNNYREKRVELMALASNLKKGSVPTFASLPFELGSYPEGQAKAVLNEIADRRKALASSKN